MTSAPFTFPGHAFLKTTKTILTAANHAVNPSCFFNDNWIIRIFPLHVNMTPLPYQKGQSFFLNSVPILP
jgi:hypothetical protein